MVTAPETSQVSRKFGLMLRRFLIPSFVVSAYAYFKLGASISPRAEVELSPFLQLGRGTRVSSFTKIKVTDGPLVTGEKCGFGTGCFVDPGSAGIRMGDHVICGPNVVHHCDQLPVCERQHVVRGTRAFVQGHHGSAETYGLVRTRSSSTAPPSATIRSSSRTASSIVGSPRIRSSREIRPR